MNRHEFKDKYIKPVYMFAERLSGILPDRTFLQFYSLLHMHRLPELDDPQTFNDKQQWLKLHYRPEILTMLADKYAVREYVAQRIGEEHLIPLLGVWDRAEDIDFDALPDRFVLKCTHDSGSIVVCENKETLNRSFVVKHLGRALKRDFFLHRREWPYKDVPRRILAEAYLREAHEGDRCDYQFFCFDGRVELFRKCTGVAHTSSWADVFYDRDYHVLPFKGTNPRTGDTSISDRSAVEQMIDYAETLSEGLPHVRVDFLSAGGHIYFGEMTFYTFGGFMKFDPPEWDRKLGDLIHLPKTASKDNER